MVFLPNGTKVVGHFAVTNAKTLETQKLPFILPPRKIRNPRRGAQATTSCHF